MGDQDGNSSVLKEQAPCVEQVSVIKSPVVRIYHHNGKELRPNDSIKPQESRVAIIVSPGGSKPCLQQLLTTNVVKIPKLTADSLANTECNKASNELTVSVEQLGNSGSKADDVATEACENREEPLPPVLDSSQKGNLTDSETDIKKSNSHVVVEEIDVERDSEFDEEDGESSYLVVDEVEDNVCDTVSEDSQSDSVNNCSPNKKRRRRSVKSPIKRTLSISEKPDLKKYCFSMSDSKPESRCAGTPEEKDTLAAESSKSSTPQKSLSEQTKTGVLLRELLTSPVSKQEERIKNGDTTPKKIQKVKMGIKEMDSEIDSLLTEMTNDSSADSDADMEDIDKVVEEMCEEEEDEKETSRKLSDSEEMELALKGMCEEEVESTKFSDCEGIDSAISELCEEEREEQVLSEQVESIIDDLCKEECEKSKDSDKLSSIDDDGSIKDGIDIESVIEAICKDEDEICDRVDSIIKSKVIGGEISDSEALDDAIDAICEEEEKEDTRCNSKRDGICKFLSPNIGNALHVTDELSKRIGIGSVMSIVDRLEATSECEDDIQKAVKSVLNVLCSVVDLQLDQIIRSERIAAMESLLHKTVSEKILLGSELEEQNGLVISDVMSSEAVDVADIGTSESAKSAVKRPALDSDDEECQVAKRLKVNNVTTFSEDATDGSSKDSAATTMDCTSSTVMDESTNKEGSGETEGSKPSGLTEQNGEIGNMKVSDLNSLAGTSTDPCDTKLKTQGEGSSKSMDENLLISNVKTCTEEAKSSTVNATESALPRPTTEVLSATPLLGNESSSDSDRSLCRTLKIDGNLQDIINRLSSPKVDINDGDMDSSSSLGEKAKISSESKEDIDKTDGKMELPNTASVNDAKSAEMSDSSFREEDLKENHTSEERISDDDESSSSSIICPMTPATLSNGCSIMVLDEFPDVIGPEIESRFIEVSDYDLGRFMRGRVHEFCMSKYGSLIQSLQDQLERMKQDLENRKKYTEKVRMTMRDLATRQNALFRQYGHNPKVEKRTVGVNVRIVQQPDNKLRTYSNMSNLSKNTGAGCQATASSTGPKLLTNTVSSRPSVPSFGLSGTPLHPAKTVQTSMPMQLLTTSPTPLNNNAIGLNPSHCVASRFSVPATSAVALPTTSVVLLTTNAVTTPASHQIVDLTDDESPKRRLAAATTTVSSQLRATTPVRGQLPSKAGASQNLVSLPLMPSMVQLLPPGTTVSNTVSDVNAVRMVRSPAGLPQPARLAYIVPNTPGSLPVIHQIGGNPQRLAVNVSPPHSALLPSNMRPPVQTFVLAPMPVVSQGGQMPPVTRNITPSTTATSSAANTTTATLGTPSQLTLTPCFNKHPAPLPQPPNYPQNLKFKALPPRPSLKMNKVANGIVLSWNMGLTSKHAEVSTYQLYAYQENKGPVSHLLWKKVGDIKALPLPMACTLTQFVEGHRYHFTVRAVDVHKRFGPFSEPSSILLCIKQKNNEPATTQSNR